jgi:hypothetical protein
MAETLPTGTPTAGDGARNKKGGAGDHLGHPPRRPTIQGAFRETGENSFGLSSSSRAQTTATQSPTYRQQTRAEQQHGGRFRHYATDKLSAANRSAR